MARETIKAIGWGTIVTLIIAILIVTGSRNLSHFDAALIGYTFAVLFAAFGVTYRYAMWLQRPPTSLLEARLAGVPLGVSFYKDAGAREQQAQCRRCGEPFASKMRVEDLIEVERKLGFRYEMSNEAGHYQWICPKCRRAILALAQGRLWQGES